MTKAAFWTKAQSLVLFIAPLLYDFNFVNDLKVSYALNDAN